MAITNRDLAVGTKLSVRYKKQLYTAEVVQGDKGIRFRLADGREFNSPSGAGAAVKGGGKTCDGWKFWSLAEGKEQTQEPIELEKTPKAKPSPAKPKLLKNLKKLPTRREGQPQRWFCSSCQAGFEVEEGVDPEHCPEGHPATVEDELAAPA